MKKIFKKFIALFILVATLLPISQIGASASDPYAVANQKFELLQKIIDLYTETSLYETDADTLVDQMIYNFIAENPFSFAALVNALLSSNDRYSAYYPAEYGFLSDTTKSFGIVMKDSGAYNDGIARKDGVYIDEVIPDSNADFAGILPGDRFVSIEGINIEGLTLDAVKRLITMMPLTDKLPEASEYYAKFKDIDIDPQDYMNYKKLDWDFTKEVYMVFERILSDGSVCLMNIAMPRGIASSKDIWFEANPETQTASIQINAFHDEKLADTFKNYTEAAIQAGCKNLIVDLRNNGGGYSDSATEIASMFTEKGKTMYYTRKRNEDPVPTVSDSEIFFTDKFEKIVVLVNGSTASASELLAYILKEQAGAAIIGETTYGKALGQDFYTLTNGDNFTITSMEILKTDLTSYNEIGITPDIYIPLVPKKYDFPTDLSVFNYINFTEISDGQTNDPTLALEQRLGILGILRTEKIDGTYDGATRSAVLLYQMLANEPKPDGTLTYTTVANITTAINSYKDTYIYDDSQLAVANLYIENKSRGKRLASEYIRELEKYNRMLEEKEAENLRELERLYEEERNNHPEDGK